MQKVLGSSLLAYGCGVGGGGGLFLGSCTRFARSPAELLFSRHSWISRFLSKLPKTKRESQQNIKDH